MRRKFCALKYVIRLKKLSLRNPRFKPWISWGGYFSYFSQRIAQIGTQASTGVSYVVIVFGRSNREKLWVRSNHRPDRHHRHSMSKWSNALFFVYCDANFEHTDISLQTCVDLILAWKNLQFTLEISTKLRYSIVENFKNQ